MAERRQELSYLVATWNQCNRNLERFLKKCPDMVEHVIHGKTILVPDRSGVAQLAWLPDLRGFSASPLRREALSLFIGLVTNPLSSVLGGPCKRCGRYYPKKDPRQNTYCRRQCKTHFTAAAAMELRRERQYQKKLAPVQNAVSEWEANPKGEWKRWVAKRAKVDLRFVTQACTRGKLIAPFGQGC
jgi:hypothetical protein